MRLKKVVINEYKSIKKRESISFYNQIAVLIGANDHGKSNILSAIKCLNDDKELLIDERNWDAKEDAIIEIEWHFSASKKAIDKLYEIYQPPASTSSSSLVKKSEEKEELSPDKKLEDKERVEKFFPTNNDNEIILSRTSQTNVVKVVSLPMQIPIDKEPLVLAIRPRVELFVPPATNLIDQLNRAQLDDPAFEFMQGIFRLAGLWEIRDTIFSQDDKTSKILDEASEKLTTVLNDRWNQGKDLKWKLQHTGINGDHIVIKIQDPAIGGRYTRPSLRSSGFRTYFLLSMITYARNQNKPDNSYIYLFDEPGTYLHPRAQLDLQRSLETIAEKAQIIYTTHSLFLINKNYPERNKVVSKTIDGTKIDQKPFIKNWKAVRESLGILLSNNFLIAEKTLLVEGPSDIIYLLNAIKKLKKDELLDVDLNDFSTVDAGSSENYVAMAKLMLSEGRGVVALLDGDEAGKNLEKQLKKICEKEISQKELKIYILPDNKSSEDIFADVDILRNAVKKVYDNLINTGVRIAKSGLNIDKELKKISTNKNISLGRNLDKLTSTLFEDGEKISKLSIALAYEDIREANGGSMPDQALAQLQKLKEFLDLRGEKSTEEGVFEEIK